MDEGWIVPVHSVGVQGDERSYRPVLVTEGQLSLEQATAVINRMSRVNRVVGMVKSHMPIERMSVRPAYLTEERLTHLRRADAIVRRMSEESGFAKKVWQFPVVVIPFGDEFRPDSVVLRPIHSVDGMTAESVVMPPDLLRGICVELMKLETIAGVFYDLTHKPPGTIEWE